MVFIKNKKKLKSTAEYKRIFALVVNYDIINLLFLNKTWKEWYDEL